MPRELTITATPFKSSRLAIPHSPFSPRSPLTPLPRPPKQNNARPSIRPSHTHLDLPAPPTRPLPWLWQCHLCNRCYQHGVTRRCLEDGHYFCSGTTTVKRSRRGGGGKKVTKHHQACASEFDYQAWKTWGEWRRGVLERLEAAGLLEEWLERGDWPLREPGASYAGSAFGRASTAEHKKDCWRDCNYPSECRWGKQFGVPSPRTPVAVPSSLSVSQVTELQPCFEDIVLNDFESDLLSDSGMVPHLNGVSSHEEDTRKPSMDDLLASAKRRKRKSLGLVASPLASNPPSCSSSASSSDSATKQAFDKASDDSELGLRKSSSRVEGLVSYLIRGKNDWDVLEDGKAEANGKRSKLRKKSASSF